MDYSTLMKKLLLLLLFLYVIKCLWNEDACLLRCSLILMWRVWLYFLYENYGILSKLNDK